LSNLGGVKDTVGKPENKKLKNGLFATFLSEENVKN